MKLLITKSIQASELQANQSIFTLDVIKSAAKKAIQGLGKKLKNTSKVSGTHLKKINLTTSGERAEFCFS